MTHLARITDSNRDAGRRNGQAVAYAVNATVDAVIEVVRELKLDNGWGSDVLLRKLRAMREEQP